MITINKMEYITKDEKLGNAINEYVTARPWLKISTSKGVIEFPLSADYDNEFYTKKFRELEKLSTNSKMNISYDFREED